MANHLRILWALRTSSDILYSSLNTTQQPTSDQTAALGQGHPDAVTPPAAAPAPVRARGTLSFLYLLIKGGVPKTSCWDKHKITSRTTVFQVYPCNK